MTNVALVLGINLGGTAKLPNAERWLGVPVASRNWNTVMTLTNLVEGRE